MQPFLLVKLPEFVFDILNRRTIDANSRCPPIGKHSRKTSPFSQKCGVTEVAPYHLIVTSQTRNVVAILAHAQTIRCSLRAAEVVA